MCAQCPDGFTCDGSRKIQPCKTDDICHQGRKANSCLLCAKQEYSGYKAGKFNYCYRGSDTETYLFNNKEDAIRQCSKETKCIGVSSEPLENNKYSWCTMALLFRLGSLLKSTKNMFESVKLVQTGTSVTALRQSTHVIHKKKGVHRVRS